MSDMCVFGLIALDAYGRQQYRGQWATDLTTLSTTPLFTKITNSLNLETMHATL